MNRDSFLQSLPELKKTIMRKYSLNLLDRTLENYYLPLIEDIFFRRDTSAKYKAMLICLAGGQGSGKSFLAELFALWFSLSGYPSLSLSIDDYYLSYKKRKRLAKRYSGNPFYQIARGLPGTHRTRLLYKSLHRAVKRKSFYLPDFEKNLLGGRGDVRGGRKVNKKGKAEFIFFEGWFVSLPLWNKKEAEKLFREDEYISGILDKMDPQRKYLNQVRENLKKYLKIRKLSDYQIYISGMDLKNVIDWRWEQEIANKRQSGLESGLSYEDIANFCRPFLPLSYLLEKYYALHFAVSEGGNTKVEQNFTVESVFREKKASSPGAMLKIDKKHRPLNLLFSH